MRVIVRIVVAIQMVIKCAASTMLLDRRWNGKLFDFGITYLDCEGSRVFQVSFLSIIQW